MVIGHESAGCVSLACSTNCPHLVALIQTSAPLEERHPKLQMLATLLLTERQDPSRQTAAHDICGHASACICESARKVGGARGLLDA